LKKHYSQRRDHWVVEGQFASALVEIYEEVMPLDGFGVVKHEDSEFVKIRQREKTTGFIQRLPNLNWLSGPKQDDK
jgi:hypothetical protein